MTGKKVRIGFLALLVAGALAAQQPSSGAPTAVPEADACMRHCKEMSQARQKMMDGRKAAAQKRDAAWKAIRADVDSARTLRGDKKVAALESALEKLLAFHESMQESMGMDHGMMGMGHPMDAMEHGMMGMDDCPMMQKEKPAPPAQ